MKHFLLLCFAFTISASSFQQTNALIQKAQSLIALQAYKEALVPLNNVLQKEADNATALSYRAFAYSRLKRYELAARDAVNLVSVQPGEAANWCNAGWYLLLNKQVDSSMLYSRKYIELAPIHHSGYLNLAHAYAALEDKKKLEYYYARASEFITNEEILNNGPLADFDLLEQEGIIPFKTAPLANLFKTAFDNNQKNKAATIVLDSISRLTAFEKVAKDDERLVVLKERFIKEEVKNADWRYYVLSDFYWDLGEREYKRRNTVQAAQYYLSNSIKLSTEARDTVTLIKRNITLAKLEKQPDPFFILQSYNLAKAANEPLLEARSLIYLTDAYGARYERDSSMYYAKLGYTLSNKLDNDELKFSAANRLYYCFSVAKNYDSSKYYFDQAARYLAAADLTIDEEFGFEADFATILNKTKCYGESIRYAEKILSKYASNKKVDHSFLLTIIGLDYYDLNDYKKAEDYLQRSLQTYKQYLADNRDVRGLKLLNKEKEETLEYLKKIYSRQKNAEGLFTVGEEAKANILFTRLTNTLAVPNAVTIKDVRKTLQQDEAVLSYSSSGRMDYGNAVAFDKNEVAILTEDITTLEKAFEEPNLQRLKKETSGLVEQFEKYTSDTTKASRATALIGFVNVLQTEAIGKLKSTLRGLNLRKDTTLFGVQERVKAANDLLYKLYVKPFEAIIKDKKTLYVSTDDVTNYLVVEALKNPEGKFLGELYKIVYVPSFSIREAWKKQQDNTNTAMLAIGNPSYSSFKASDMKGRAYDLSQWGFGNWSDLPGTGKELQKLQSTVPGVNVLQQDKVSETNLRQLNESGKLQQYGYLHFALHGMMKLNDYEDNSLILTEKQGGREDGFLQFWEVADLKINARLVCLSACETALGIPEENNDMNLATAFMLAGARSVIASTWKIDDEATSIFMSEFYKKIFVEKMQPSDALYQTRLQFIQGNFGQEYRSPSYWAAFRYVGY
jgi:CHAT domain-containing protein